MKIYSNNKELLEYYNDLCISIINVSKSNTILKQYIGLLKLPQEEISQYKHMCSLIINSLSSIFNERVQSEIFLFTGKLNSGMYLATKKMLPIDGFCFFGYISLYRSNQF